MHSQAQALFLASPRGGQRFCLYHAPHPPVRAMLVYVHPFAEEMNKSRRVAALQARALASIGCAVLQIDLLGCGDSSGDFGEASWEAWIDDVVVGCRWMHERMQAPLWLWGLRVGCLVASAAAHRVDRDINLLFWQPTVSGAVALQQFLRLKAAGELASGRSRGLTQTLRDRLAHGETIDVAGYLVSPALAAGLESATLEPPPRCGRVEWIELCQPGGAVSTRASSDCIARWEAAGVCVGRHAVSGPMFWQTVEIEEAPALVESTLLVLRKEAAVMDTAGGGCPSPAVLRRASQTV